jgi:curli biogenesis system outer membrane secretion channel CsgG
MKFIFLVRGTVIAALLLPMLPAAAQIKSKHSASAESTRAKKVAELPNCARPLGTVALAEPETRWWGDLGLGSPEALIRVYIQKSHCFRLVNRSNRGTQNMLQERALNAGGEMRRGGSIGKGQMVEADFTVIPDIVTSNNNKDGMNIGGLLGAFVPGIGGALLGGISLKKRSANVVLSVVDNKSSEEFVAEGQSKKSDLGFGAGAGVFGGGMLGAGGATGYDNTEMGQVIALAYLDAYTKLVENLGGVGAAIAGPQAEKAVTLKRPSRMFAAAAMTSRMVKMLDAGAILYPTGQKTGGLWEVEDELGTRGWVSEASLAVAR